MQARGQQAESAFFSKRGEEEGVAQLRDDTTVGLWIRIRLHEYLPMRCCAEAAMG